MVKITNGSVVYEVTNGAYEGIYKHQGFYPVENKVEAVAEQVAASTEPDKDPNLVFVEELLEKPISQWNKNEVKEFARIKEIDLTGTKNVNEAKALIQQHIQEDQSEEE